MTRQGGESGREEEWEGNEMTRRSRTKLTEEGKMENTKG